MSLDAGGGAEGHRQPQLKPERGASTCISAMWSEIVDSKPSDWFDLDSVPVLKEYIRAALTCDELAGVVERALESGDDKFMKSALDMRDKEARRVASLATKLRLTQQSRYTPQSAATANRKAGGKRPWQT